MCFNRMRLINNTEVNEEIMQTSIGTVTDGCAHEQKFGACV
jgi:hypothetical protein